MDDAGNRGPKPTSQVGRTRGGGRRSCLTAVCVQPACSGGKAKAQAGSPWAASGGFDAARAALLLCGACSAACCMPAPRAAFACASASAYDGTLSLTYHRTIGLHILDMKQGRACQTTHAFLLIRTPRQTGGLVVTATLAQRPQYYPLSGREYIALCDANMHRVYQHVSVCQRWNAEWASHRPTSKC